MVYNSRKKKTTIRIDGSLLLKATPLNLAIVSSERKDKRTPYSDYDIGDESVMMESGLNGKEYTIDKKRELVVPWAFENLLQLDWLVGDTRK